MGVDVVALVDVADARKAHGMVYHGEVDVIVYGRPGDLPTVRQLMPAGGRTEHVRGAGSPRLRRPQMLGERTQYLGRA